MGWSIGDIGMTVATGGLYGAAKMYGDSKTKQHENAKNANQSYWSNYTSDLFDKTFRSDDMNKARADYLSAVKATSPTADKINQEASQVAANAAYKGGGVGAGLNAQQRAEVSSRYAQGRAKQVAEDRVKAEGDYFDAISGLAKTEAGLDIAGQQMAAATQPEKGSLLGDILGGTGII